MAAPKGHPRYGGRRKNTPNRKTEELVDICGSRGLNVFEAMVQLTLDEMDSVKKFERLKELAHYLYPKRKAVEHSIEGDGEIRVTVHDYTSPRTTG